jgi:hypothetical protein
MIYNYEFDNTRVGDFRLTTADFRILQEAYRLLREGLDEWNRRALANGAVRSPYEQEVDDLNRMIEWGDEQLAQPGRIVLLHGLSVGTLRYEKAALMLMIWKREQDCAEKAREGWPTAALRSLTDGVDDSKKFAAEINYEPNDVLWELIPRKIVAAPEAEVPRAAQWDVFVSHASEDKEVFARPLAEGLRKNGLRVWFDEFTLTIGDSLRRSIDRGLAHSRFGVVVISADFLRKEWPQKELDGLVAREVHGVKVILPVWHGIGADQVRAYSPTLADRYAASSEEGLDHVIGELVRAIRRGDEPEHGESPRETNGVPAPKAATLAGIGDLWVNSDYPEKSGLIDKLRADGYDIKWERAVDEASSIDLEGWEHVVVDRPRGAHVRLKIRDAPIVGGYVVLLKRRKASIGL